MSLHRRNARRDQSEKDIVDYLRKSGWSVDYLSAKDQPDLLLGKYGVTLLAEVKSGTKKLRPGQEKWHAAWRGGAPYVLRSVEDAAALTRAMGSLKGQ